MAARTVFAAFLLFLGMCIIITSGRPAPSSNAFCRIIWLFGVPCDQVNMAIVTGIKDDKKSYKLGPVTPDQILANHTAKDGEIANLNFTMDSTTLSMGCHVQGSSVSPFWFSPFDNGTNYCNLYKVIKGSGLNKTPGFVEFTNEWLCLGFGASVCK